MHGYILCVFFSFFSELFNYNEMLKRAYPSSSSTPDRPTDRHRYRLPPRDWSLYCRHNGLEVVACPGVYRTWVVAGNPVVGNPVVVDNIDLVVVVGRIVGVGCSSLQRRAGHMEPARGRRALRLGGWGVGRRGEVRFAGLFLGRFQG